MIPWLRAIEQYLRGKQMHLSAMDAQRRLEARIGQLLGEAHVDVSNPHHDEVSHDQTRSDFRTLGPALGSLT